MAKKTKKKADSLKEIAVEKQEPKKVYPSEPFAISIQDQSSDVVGHPSNAGGRGTMLAKGWHDNYANFSDETEGFDGCIISIGSNVYVEVNNNRYLLDLKDVVNHLVNKTLEEEKAHKKASKKMKSKSKK